MPSYLGPGELAAFSAAAYSRYASSLTPIPLRSIPRSPGTPLRSLISKSPQDSRTVLRPQRCSLRSPVAKEFTRLARTIASGIRPSAISSRSLKPLRQKDIPKTQTHQNRIHIPWHLSVLSCIHPPPYLHAHHRTTSFKGQSAIPCQPSHTAGPALLQPSDSRHLRNIIQPLLCDCPSGLPSGRGSAHTAHNPDYVKYLPPPPFSKVDPARSLFISVPRVSTFSKERAECRHTAPSDMAFSHSHKCLRPTPPTPPDHWSAPAPPLAAPAPSPSASSHPKLPVLRPRRFGAAPSQGQCTRNPPPDRNKSVPERTSGIIILTRDCTRQAVRRLSFGPAV